VRATERNPTALHLAPAARGEPLAIRAAGQLPPRQTGTDPLIVGDGHPTPGSHYRDPVLVFVRYKIFHGIMAANNDIIAQSHHREANSSEVFIYEESNLREIRVLERAGHAILGCTLS
jgi:hypothetical protein